MPPKRRFITCEICKNRASRANLEKRMFMARFPLDEDRCKQWVKFVGKEDLIYVPIEKLHTLKYVCGNHFDKRAFNKKQNRLKKWAIPSKNLNADPLPDEMLLQFPCHIYSNVDVTTTNTSQGIIDNEASLFQAGPSTSDSCTGGQQLLADESSDKQEIQSRKRKQSSSSDNQSVSRENQGLQQAAPSTVDEELDTNVTAEVQESLDKSPSPVEEEADDEVAGEVQGLQDASSPGPVDEEPDAPVQVKEVCRICLAFNVKMYNIQEYNLCQMLYDITGIKVGENDGIFQYVCFECAARLSAASVFRHKALKSDGMLQRLMNCGDTIAEQLTFLKENLEILKPTLTVQDVFTTTDIADEPNSIKLNLIDDKTVETTKPVIIKEKYKDIVKTFCDVETIDNFVPTERSLTMNEDGSVAICENIKEHENDSTTLPGEEDNCNAITKEELTGRVRERLKEFKCSNVPDLAKEFGVTTEIVQKIIDDAGLKKGYKRKKGSALNQRGAWKKSKIS